MSRLRAVAPGRADSRAPGELNRLNSATTARSRYRRRVEGMRLSPVSCQRRLQIEEMVVKNEVAAMTFALLASLGLSAPAADAKEIAYTKHARQTLSQRTIQLLRYW